MRISVFGMGYVGTVSAACFADLGHDVIGVDVNPGKIDMINRGLSPVVEEGLDEAVAAAVQSGRLRAIDDTQAAVMQSDVSLISVGTPMSRNGAPMLDALDAVVEGIGAALRHKNGGHTVVLRSTVPPGTTEGRMLPALAARSGRDCDNGLAVAFNPEFLREGCSVKDFRRPPFTIAGAPTTAGYEAVEALYRGIDAPFIRTTTGVAESVKYLSNAFHAVKIAFANEAGVLLKSLGVDAQEAMKVFCADRQLNISPAYLRPGFAFGGSCLPKDVSALVALAKARDIDLPFLSSVMAANDAHIDRALQAILDEGRRKVALLGLAFKPGTDDLRHSPFVYLAERLVGKGYDLAIFDRDVHASKLLGKNREFIEREIPHFDRLLIADLRRALDGAGMIVVGHANREDVATLEAAHDGRPILDLQGVPALSLLPGARYRSLC
ncbi:MAG: UDP-glucose/GDP-mannose dehydrogenase family protein [Alphaproteobacteria bacterium]|nr:UDP-glucose/GDP-mannose dehydrogenase family protein [Alphaproteobacteria bacterium]